MARLFLAVWPPEDLAEQLRALPRKDQRGVRFVRPDNWHITLRFLGEADVRDVFAALDGVELPPARAHLGAGVDVISDRALVVRVDGLDALARVVNDHTADIGEPPRKRFVGHLTIARLKRHAAMPKALGSLVTAEFDVEEVSLVRSTLHPDGA